MHAYETVEAAHQGVARYLTFYNQTRPHQALDGQTPDQVYDENRTAQQTVAYSTTREAPLKECATLSSQLEPPLSLGLHSIQYKPLVKHSSQGLILLA